MRLVFAHHSVSSARALGTLAIVIGASVTALGQSAQSPKFDAADVYVRPHRATALPSMTAGMLRGDRYDFRNVTMLDLIGTAYGVDRDRVLGGPNWLEWDRFDVVAKAPRGTSAATINAMLQTLLAERFRLVVHQDSKLVAGFALTSGSGKPKLKAASDSNAGRCDALPNQQSGATLLAGITCHGVTMEAFAAALRARAGGYLTGQLLDLTGLKGAWDADLRWTPRALVTRANGDGVTLANALDQQLGLELEPHEVPTTVLAVDSVNEKPTPNPSGVSDDLPSPPPADFDVADIKIAPTDGPQTGHIEPSGRLDLQGFTMKSLVKLAWTINDDELLADGPKWMEVTKYSLVAKSTTAIAGTTSAVQIDIDDLRLMLRALLVQRFKIATHFEDRPVSAYTLVADKPKLHPADPANRTNCKDGPAPGAKDPRETSPMLSRLVTCQNMTLKQLAEDLPRIAGGYIHIPVVDATGIEGAWDFTLNFSPNGQLANAGRGADASAAPAGPLTASDPTGGLSLFDALQKQLGLKLEQNKRPMPVLVFDHIEETPSND